jgi:hypothetical protein
MKRLVVALGLSGASCGAAYPIALTQCTSVTVEKSNGDPGCSILFGGCPDHGTATANCDGTSSCTCAWHSDYTNGTEQGSSPADFCVETSSQIRASATECGLCGGCGV